VNHKAIATEFLKAAAAGQARAAFSKYAAPGFRHHNAYFKGDANSLAAAMDQNARQNPGKTLDVKQTIEEGDRVAVLSHVRHGPNGPDAAVVHVFRFEGDRIAELWDVGQEIPNDSPNVYGMF
jgi:predicted SnoaL-like aldol condensation-catalyzing enzyme